MATVVWSRDAVYASRSALRRRAQEADEVIAELQRLQRLSATQLPSKLGVAQTLSRLLRKAEAMRNEMLLLCRRLEQVEDCFEGTERSLRERAQALLQRAEEEATWPKGTLQAWFRKPPMLVFPPPRVMTDREPVIRVPGRSMIIAASLVRNAFAAKRIAPMIAWDGGVSPMQPDLIVPSWLCDRM